MSEVEDLIARLEAATEGSRDWTLWCDNRPTNTNALYRWRATPRMICGIELQPEWSGHLRYVGMGYADSEWWPPYSRWDGYRRTVPNGLEWRLAVESEDEKNINWGDLGLLPDPWTGNPPPIGHTERWIHAGPLEVASFCLRTQWGTSYGWASLPRLISAWNSRAALAHQKQEGE